METIEGIPTNLKSNILALQNCIFISSKKTKDPSQTIHLKIKDKYIKCRYSNDVREDNLGMSKNIREYLSLDTAHSIVAQPISGIDESKLYLKDMTI